jgi:hypothetical protein
MKTVQKKPAEEFRMSGADFDRIMGQALQVKPEVKLAKKAKKKTKKI